MRFAARRLRGGKTMKTRLFSVVATVWMLVMAVWVLGAPFKV